MAETATLIGIAVVEQQGSFLVGRRQKDVPLAGCCEFPGGKCRPGESPQDCAIRECREETGLEVVPVRLLLNHTFEYPHGTVDLHFWLCAPADAASIAIEHRGYRWVEAEALNRLDFPEANAPVIAMLVARGNEQWR